MGRPQIEGERRGEGGKGGGAAFSPQRSLQHGSKKTGPDLPDVRGAILGRKKKGEKEKGGRERECVNECLTRGERVQSRNLPSHFWKARTSIEGEGGGGGGKKGEKKRRVLCSYRILWMTEGEEKN